MTDQITVEHDFGICAGCGKTAQKYMSGTPVCWGCWHWEKLGLPAAKFWIHGIDHLLSNEYGSGPDPNDNLLWDQLGIREDVEKALTTLIQLRGQYEREMKRNG